MDSNELLIMMLLLQARDIAEKDQTIESLTALSLTDSLTGLGNKRARDRAMRIEISRSYREKQPFVLARIDVDDFKDVNTLIGHDEADRVLATLGQIIPPTIRPTDQAFLFGGDEFDILLTSVTAEQAVPILQRVKKAIDDYVFQQENGSSISITVSIGLTVYPNAQCSLEDQADIDSLILRLGTQASAALTDFAKTGEGISIFTPHS